MVLYHRRPASPTIVLEVYPTTMPERTLHPHEQETVLVIDDFKFNRQLLSSILSDEGLHVIEAEDATAGLRMAADSKPDLILLDIMLPGVDGYEACRVLTTDPSTSDIPVIFISALESAEARIQGFRMGAVDYIPRPFHKDEVVARVRVHLRLRYAHTQLLDEQRARLLSLQRAHKFLLTNPETLPEARVAVRYEPMEEVGGDFYEILSFSSDFVACFVSDISGHDVGAALVHSAIKTVLGSWAGPLYSPLETMVMMNRMLKPLFSSGDFLTAAYLFVNRKARRATVVSCAHPPAFISSPGVGVREIRSEGDPIGVFDRPVFGVTELDLKAGDRFWLYTDGVVEDLGLGIHLGDGLMRLAGRIEGASALGLDEAIAEVYEGLTGEFMRKTDDRLLLACEALAEEVAHA